MRKEGSKTTSFIEKTRQWYRDRGLEDEFYRLYICSTCKFSHTCAGIHLAFLEEKYNTLYRLRRGE